MSEQIKETCVTCSLCSEFKDKSYKDEIWCEYHQQPKFNDDKCDTYISKDQTDLKVEI